jgi:peptidoglycan/LPS O-acetylase OafA/YrhL
MIQSSGKSQDRLSGLDSVRGLAIILVVIFHYVYSRVSSTWLGVLIGPFGLGGVTLFFFLSGFLMERHLVRDGDLVRYFSRRFFRIIPAYFVCLIVVLLIQKTNYSSGSTTTYDFVINAILMQDLFGVPLMLGVIWTLLIETKFYFLAPFVMRAGTAALRLAPYACITTNAAVFLFRGEASTFLTYLTFCFVGMQFGPWSRGEMHGFVLGALVVISAAATAVFGAYFALGLAIFVVLNAVVLALGIRFLPILPVLPFVGKVSYSWYLYHTAIGYPLAFALAAWLGETTWMQVIIVLAAMSATLFVAWLSFIIVENPAIVFGRVLEQNLRPSSPKFGSTSKSSPPAT